MIYEIANQCKFMVLQILFNEETEFIRNPANTIIISVQLLNRDRNLLFRIITSGITIKME